jgi:alpha-glucosidase
MFVRLSGGKHADPSGADLVDFDSYDITGRCVVDRVFGTLAGFDGHLTAAHVRGLRVLAGLGPNHTSHRHPWFVGAGSAGAGLVREG